MMPRRYRYASYLAIWWFLRAQIRHVFLFFRVKSTAIPSKRPERQQKREAAVTARARQSSDESKGSLTGDVTNCLNGGGVVILLRNTLHAMNLEHARKTGRVLGIGGQSRRLHKVAPDAEQQQQQQQQQDRQYRQMLGGTKHVKPASWKSTGNEAIDEPSLSHLARTDSCERADQSKAEKASHPQHHNPVPERNPPAASIMKIATLQESLHKYSGNKRGLFSTIASKHSRRTCRSSIDDEDGDDDDDDDDASSSCADKSICSSNRSCGLANLVQAAGQSMHVVSAPSHSSNQHHHIGWRHRPPFHVRPTRSRSLSLEEVNRISPEDWSLQRRRTKQHAQRAKEKSVQDGKDAWLPPRYVDKDIEFGTVQFRYYNEPVPSKHCSTSSINWITVYDEDLPVPLEQYEMSRPPRRQLYQGRQESFAYNLYRELCDARNNTYILSKFTSPQSN